LSQPSNGWIYRINPADTSLVLLPSLGTEKDKGQGATTPSSTVASNVPAPAPAVCDVLSATRTTALAVLFITSLPTTILSCSLGYYKEIFSMSIPLFFFVSAGVVNIYIVVDPTVANLSLLLRWWSTVFSTLWLAIAMLLILTNRVLTNKTRVAWVVSIGCLVYVKSNLYFGLPSYYFTFNLTYFNIYITFFSSFFSHFFTNKIPGTLVQFMLSLSFPSKTIGGAGCCTKSSWSFRCFCTESSPIKCSLCSCLRQV